VPTRFGSNYVLTAFARALLGWCLAFRGDFEVARAHAETGVQAAEASGHELSRVFALNGVAGIDVLQGNGAAAVSRVRRALEVGQGSGTLQHMATLHWTLGQALTLLGRGEEAVESLERAAEISAGHQQMAFHPRDVIGLGEAYLVAGRLDDAMRTVQRGLALARTHGQTWGEADGLRILGGVLTAGTSPDLAGARAALEQASSLAGSLGMRPLAARCHLALAECHARTGALGDAECHRHTARRMFGEMHMARWLEELDSR
jgi:tetratricopeptide (TPR) repeat protein